MKQKGFAPIIILLLIAGLGLLAYFSFFYKPNQSNYNISTATPLSDSGLDTTNSCEILWVNPILPKGEEIEPLFLHKTEAARESGYEAIARRQVQDGYISVDVVTNSLPENNSPYYLWALAVDSNGSICSQSNLGSFEKIPKVGSWVAGPFTLPLANVNDAQLFVITEKGFGSNSSDSISNLSEPSIILEGSYQENHKR